MLPSPVNILETFLRQVDWRPPQTATIAGALRYSKYGTFKKLLVRLIATGSVMTPIPRGITNTRTGMTWHVSRMRMRSGFSRPEICP